MDLYIYSDESGVLDKNHNTYFVFGGIVFTSKQSRDDHSRKYLAVERSIRRNTGKKFTDEVKATTISNKDKKKLFRSLNQTQKFGVVVYQPDLFDSMFKSKKSKQRYLDWVYKMSIKKKFSELIAKGLIIPSEVEHITFYVDEHTTATDGKYELEESLEQELKYGTYNWEYMTQFPPLFTNLASLEVRFCDSKSQTLVRAADIVANQLYHMAIINDYSELEGRNFYIYHHPQR